MFTPQNIRFPMSISTKKSEQKMFKSSAVTAVTIIVDNSREGPFWLELKDYRQCNSVQPLQSFTRPPYFLIQYVDDTFFF